MCICYKKESLDAPENSRSARRAEEQIDARVAEVAQSLQQLEAPTPAGNHMPVFQ